MYTKSVYLCGPISGLTYEEAVGWRNELVLDFEKSNITLLDPMRGTETLKGHSNLDPLGYKHKPTLTGKGIIARDFFDVKRADIILANFCNAKRVSIGSVVEFGWASAFNKPIILVIDKDNIHNHAFIYELADYVVDNIEDASEIIYDFFHQS